MALLVLLEAAVHFLSALVIIKGAYKQCASTVFKDTVELAMSKKNVSCPVELTLSVIAGRWKVMIIHQLLEGTKRFNQLQRELSGITHRTLAKQLREMEANGVVERRDYKEIPPRVEYSLTTFGMTLKDVLLAMHAWAENHGHNLPR